MKIKPPSCIIIWRKGGRNRTQIWFTSFILPYILIHRISSLAGEVQIGHLRLTVVHLIRKKFIMFLRSNEGQSEAAWWLWHGRDRLQLTFCYVYPVAQVDVALLMMPFDTSKFWTYPVSWPIVIWVTLSKSLTARIHILQTQPSFLVDKDEASQFRTWFVFLTMH